MAVNVFDATFYKAANPDLAGLNNDQLLSHFQTTGLNENRLFSPLANLNSYRASNLDLLSLNPQQLYNHLQTSGIAEGRRFSSFVDISYYRLANPDLSGLSNEALFTHLQTVGLNEGRQFSADFNPAFYQAVNADLSVLTTARQLLFHLNISGLDEGRKFSPLINLDYYRASNADLAGLSPRNALLHLEAAGFNEGRTFSPFFDINYYRSNNADLRGTNRQLFDHFEYAGISEGRPGRTDIAGNSFGSAANLSAGSAIDFSIDYVGLNDSEDYYRFTLAQPSIFVLLTENFGTGSSNVFGELLNSSGQVLQSGNYTTNGSSLPDVLTQLQAGTYYLRFTSIGGSTNYFFAFGAV